MDLLDKSATALDFVVEGELATSVTSSRSPRSVDGNGKLEANGSCVDAIPSFEAGEDVGSITPLGSKEVVGLSDSSPSAGSSSPAIKGYGLKKWRRIRRDVVKDTSGVSDSSKPVKRGLSGAGASVRSVNRGSVENNREASEVFVGPSFGYENGVPGSSSDSRFAVGSAFTTGADSENSVSEDRSSKSSTAASAPRARNDLGGGSGYGVENQRIKSYPVKVAGSSVQRGQQGKGNMESSKKARGERAKIEKQSSHSSMESDSRSSNFVFSQGLYSATSNGKQSEMSMNDDGEENSVEAHGCEEQDIEELRTRYDHETVDEVGDHSHDDSAVHASSHNKGEKNESNDSSTEKDTLVESLIMLQAVQEALESEINKFGEIGKISSPIDPPHTNATASSSFSQFEAGKVEEVSMPFQNAKHLESRLKEVLTMVCSKEAKVAELEEKWKRGESDNRELEADFKSRSEEMEIELEALFLQKIEAEVQCLTLRKTLQESNANESNHREPLSAEIKALIGEQEQMRQKVSLVENKAMAIKKSAEEVTKHRGEVLDAEEEGSNIRKGIRKTVTCFLIQLVLLVLVLWLMVVEMSTRNGVVVVPT